MVGATGFEPATSCSQGRHSSQAEPRPDFIIFFKILLKHAESKLSTFRLGLAFKTKPALCPLFKFAEYVDYVFIKTKLKYKTGKGFSREKE